MSPTYFKLIGERCYFIKALLLLFLFCSFSAPCFAKSEKEKPWKIEISTALEYSDNITRTEQDTVSQEEDHSANFDLSGEYKVMDTAKDDIFLGYDFSQTLYDQVSSLDYQSHTFSLSGSHDFGNLDSGLEYIYSFSQLGGKDFMSIHSVVPNIDFFLTDSIFFSANYIASHKRFVSDRARDGMHHSIGFSVLKFFLDNTAFIEVGYRGGLEDTRSPEFDFLGHTASGAVQFSLPLKLTADMSYSYTLRDYENQTTSIGDEREDKKHAYRLSLSRKFGLFEFKANYSHHDVKSNLVAVNAIENAIDVGVVFTY